MKDVWRIELSQRLEEDTSVPGEISSEGTFWF
jgi:hypothetical protein